MFDFTVRDQGDHWVLQDTENGELGRYDSRDEALEAAGQWMRLIERPWPVLICDRDGEWHETEVAPTVFH
jgi:hypothetical protein